MTLPEAREKLERYGQEQLLRFYGELDETEKSALLEMRKHFSWYVSGRRGAAQVRTKINLATDFGEVEALLRSLEGA